MTSPEQSVTATVLVSADGADWRDVSAPMYWLSVEDDDRLTDKAIVRFEDTTGILADASFEGLELRIAINDSDRPTYIFEGVVTSARVLAAPRHQKIEVVALDFTYRMSARQYDPADWKPGETLKSVLTRIVGRPENDLVPFQIDPAANIVLDKRRPARLANVNEWEFVLTQAQRQGCLAFCEFDGVDSSNFYFIPQAKVLAAEPIGELHYGRGVGNLFEFCYERSAATAAPMRAAATIDPVTGTARTAPRTEVASRPPVPAPVTDRMPDLDGGRRTAIDSLTELAATAAAKLAHPTERVSGEAARTAEELDRSVPVDRTSVLGFHGRGIAAGTASLRAKSQVRISGVSAWAEGDWYVRQVNHIFQRADTGPHTSYSTEFVATR